MEWDEDASSKVLCGVAAFLQRYDLSQQASEEGTRRYGAMNTEH